jgi:hypothetical protein
VGRIHNYLQDVDGIELIPILIFVARKTAAYRMASPARFNRVKFVFAYSLCLGATLIFQNPESGQTPNLIGLWLTSLLMTASIYQWLPWR